MVLQFLLKQSATISFLPFAGNHFLQAIFDGLQFEYLRAVFGKEPTLGDNLIDLSNAAHLLLVVLFSHLGNCRHGLT